MPDGIGGKARPWMHAERGGLARQRQGALCCRKGPWALCGEGKQGRGREAGRAPRRPVPPFLPSLGIRLLPAQKSKKAHGESARIVFVTKQNPFLKHATATMTEKTTRFFIPVAGRFLHPNGERDPVPLWNGLPGLPNLAHLLEPRLDLWVGHLPFFNRHEAVAFSFALEKREYGKQNGIDESRNTGGEERRGQTGPQERHSGE